MTKSLENTSLVTMKVEQMFCRSETGEKFMKKTLFMRGNMVPCTCAERGDKMAAACGTCDQRFCIFIG